MRADHRMRRRRIDPALILDAAIGVAAAVDVLGLVTRGQPGKHLLHRRRQRVVGRVHVREQRVAADLRQHVNLQHGAERRLFIARHVRVPEFAVGHLRIALRMDDEQFGEAGHLRRRRMHVQLTEHSAHRDLHGRRNLRLAFEEEHPELAERGADLAVGFLVEAAGQIDAPHFPPERRRKRFHLDSPARNRSRCVDALQQRIPPGTAYSCTAPTAPAALPDARLPRNAVNPDTP